MMEDTLERLELAEFHWPTTKGEPLGHGSCAVRVYVGK